jgi:hypothetical protein
VSTQLLIYKSAVPIDRAVHHDCCVDIGKNYGFAAEINSVPLMGVEFSLAVSEFPIVFGGARGDLTPVAILGVRSNENLFLDQDGSWQGKYIPAFVRRYPFVFSNVQEKMVLCIDEDFSGFNREGRGQRLFTADGSPSPYVEGILRFLQDYQTQLTATKRFCDRISGLDLLEPTTAKVTPPSGEAISLGGFLAVNRAKLKALPAATIADLAQSDDLELIYAHLQSLRNFDNLRARLGGPPPSASVH